MKLSGFGNFELRNKASRPGRNPKTGESIPVSARRVVAFKPGQNYVLAWKIPSQNNSKKSAVVLTALLSGLNMNKIKCAF